MTGELRTDPLSLTQALIRCPSVTPAEAGALDVLQNALESAGFVCARLPFSEAGTPDVDNLYARWGSGGPHLCFAGHTDVVPPGDENLWSLAPFSGEVRDGELYGRGAVDMKGGVACFAAAAIAQVRNLEPEKASVSLLITGDEEGPSVNGTAKMLTWLVEHDEVPDHCIVGEPSNRIELGDSIKIGRRGSLSSFISVTGKQGHVAYPHLADNPVPKLMALLTRLNAEPLDQGTEHFEPSNLEVVTVDVGNPAVNVIPAKASAALNIRFNSHHTAESLQSWIEGHCDAVRSEMGGEWDVSCRSSADCFMTEPGEFVSIVRDAVEAATGRTPDLTTNGGTSDARFIKDHCPVVEFGLVGQTMHQIDERVVVEDLNRLTDIYRRVIETYFDKSPLP